MELTDYETHRHRRINGKCPCERCCISEPDILGRMTGVPLALMGLSDAAMKRMEL